LKRRFATNRSFAKIIKHQLVALKTYSIETGIQNLGLGLK